MMYVPGCVQSPIGEIFSSRVGGALGKDVAFQTSKGPVVETVPFSHFAGSFTFEAIGAGACSVRERGRYSAVFLVSHHVLVSGASYRCVICPRKPLVAGKRRSENGVCLVCSID